MKINKDGSARRSRLQNSVKRSGGIVKIDGATIDYDENEKKWLLNGIIPGKKGNLSNLSQALRKIVLKKNRDGLNDTTHRLGIFLQNNGYIFDTPFQEENNRKIGPSEDFRLPKKNSEQEGSTPSYKPNRIDKFEDHYGILVRYSSVDCNLFKTEKAFKSEIKYLFYKNINQSKSIILEKDKIISLCKKNNIPINDSTRLQLSEKGDFEIALSNKTSVSSCVLENPNHKTQLALDLLRSLNKKKEISNYINDDGQINVDKITPKHNEYKHEKEFSIPEEIFDSEELHYYEGAKKTIIVNKYERDHRARSERLKDHNYSCEICKFNFEQFYGLIGKEFIHVHHLVPLKEIGEEYSLNPQKDLLPVCPNCHAMLHRMDNPSDIRSLINIIAKIKRG